MQTRFDRKLASLMENGKGALLLAVSGGIDSMCMARLALNSRACGRIAIAHMNFSLRGEESDGDEQLVKRFASENSIPLFSRKVDTVSFAKENSVSIEMAARTLRYQWFEELSAEEGFDYVAVAHNSNDSAETLFLNLLRGTGIKGMCGIREKNGKIVRPMLQFSRKEIEVYARENKIPYRTDSTNGDIAYHRNRIRNVIFPEFEKINPSFLDTVSDETGYFSQVNDIVEELFNEKKGEFYSEKDGVKTILIAGLLKERHSAYWLFRMLDPLGFNGSQIQLIQRCMENDAQSGKQFFSATHRAILDRGTLKIYPAASDTAENHYMLRVYKRPSDLNPKDGWYVDARKLGLEEGVYHLDGECHICQREWRPADKFIPFGMNGSKKISDFLTDLKLDLEQKDHQKVIAAKNPDGSETIVFVAGRIDDRFRINSNTDLIAEIISD